MTKEQDLKIKTGCVTEQLANGRWVARYGWRGHRWTGATELEALQKAHRFLMRQGK